MTSIRANSHKTHKITNSEMVFIVSCFPNAIVEVSVCVCMCVCVYTCDFVDVAINHSLIAANMFNGMESYCAYQNTLCLCLCVCPRRFFGCLVAVFQASNCFGKSYVETQQPQAPTTLLFSQSQPFNKRVANAQCQELDRHTETQLHFMRIMKEATKPI